MPLNDPTSFGTLGRRRRSEPTRINLLRPRRDETDPPQDLAPYWPEAQQIAQSKTEYEEANERPLWARLLNVPSVLLGGEAVRGAIKGGAEGGLGGALVGAFRGSPIAGAIDIVGDIFGDDPNVFQETRFSDIRKAFGQTNTDEGGANFAINLLGDILLDPVTYINPLGFITKAETAATVAAKGLTLQKQVTAGIRGGLVFRIPLLQQTGFDILEGIAKVPLPYFDSFKSLNVQFAKGMDNLYGILRTSPLLGPVLQKFGAVPIRDAEAAAKLKSARILSREKADVYVNGLLERYNALPTDLKQAIAGHQEYGKGIIDLMESGVLKLDNEGLLTDYMRRLPQIQRNLAFKKQYKTDEAFRSLWGQAARADPDDAVKATRALYERYDYWLPQKWLDEAGLTPRMGIDVEAPDTLAGGIGEALAGTGIQTAMEGQRATTTALARGAGETGQAAFRARQEAARVERFKGLWAAMDKGEIDRHGVEELMGIHKEAMEAVAATDLASKVINGTLEPYFGRMMTPAMKRFLDKQQLAGFSKFKFAGQGASFTKQRLLTDMTTTEADAFLMEIGSKVTGFEGLNVSVQQFKRELGEHGHWAVLKYAFPQKWVQKLNRVDEELGSFFQSNPILADVWRIKKSGELFQRSEFFKYAFAADSPLILDAARLADPHAAMSLINVAKQKGWSLNIISEKGMLPKPEGAGEIISDVVGKDLRARIGIHDHAITQELNLQLADKTTTFDTRLAQYGDLLKIGNRSDLAFSNTTPYAEAMLKRSVGEKLAAGRTLQEARNELSKLTAETSGKRAAIQKDIDNLMGLVESDKERLALFAEGPIDWTKIDEWNRSASAQVEAILAGETLLSGARAAKRGVKAPSDVLGPIQERVLAAAGQLQRARAQEFSVRASIKHTVENMRTAQREVLSTRASGTAAEKQLLREAMDRLGKQGITAEMISNETKLWHRFRSEGTLGWDELTPAAQARMLKAGGDARLVAMHPETLEAAKKFHGAFTTPDSLRGQQWVTKLDSIRSWFVSMTVMHPAMVQTRMRDVLGGLLTAGQGGFYSADMMAAAGKMTHLIGRAAKQGVTPASLAAKEGHVFTRAVDGAQMTMAQALQEMQRGGLVGADLIRDSLLDVVQESAALTGGVKGQNIMDWALGAFGLGRPEIAGGKGLFNVQANPVLRVGNKFARYGDDAVRVQTFLSAWHQGQNIQDSIRTATHWTYGAGKDITSFERYVGRRFIPFLGFTKWATQRSAELWLNKPGTLNWLGLARDNAFNSLGLEPSEMQRVLPKFINDNLGIPVANTPEGPKFYLFGSMHPLGAVFDLVNAASSALTGQLPESLRYVGQNMHPLLKSMGELVLNRDFFQGREISQFPGDQHELLGVEMPKPIRHVLRSWFRGLSELDRLNVFNAAEMRVMVDAVRRGDVLGRRKELPAIERFLSSAFGPVPTKGYQVDVEEELRRQRNLDQRELSDSKAKLRKAVEEGKTGDVAALQDVISDEIGKIHVRKELATKYLVDEVATKKIRLVR